MKLIIESTTKVVELNGVPARIWTGRTESGGIAVHCYITRVAVDRSQDCSQFERELEEHLEPTPELLAIPLRMIP